MNKFFAYLLIAALIAITASSVFAQQNQNTPEQEIETLKKQVLELQKQLQVVENDEKLELKAKLAEANAKLLNAEFDKFKNELRESNNEWLRAWSTWFWTIIGIFIAILLGVSAAFWYWLKTKTDKLIADRVEKSLNGFKESVEQVKVLKEELGELEEQHASSVLESHMNTDKGSSYPEAINALSVKVLLQVFSNQTRRLAIRNKAGEVLADRKSPKLVLPALEFLNSAIDSDLDLVPEWGTPAEIKHYLDRYISYVGKIYTRESHQKLKQFLNLLITENPKQKDLLLTRTVYSLARISVELGTKNPVSILKSAVSHIQEPDHNLSVLVEYFDQFQEHDGIKEILTNSLTDNLPDVEKQCLELLEKHDPDFVKEWKAQKETANTKNEESI